MSWFVINTIGAVLALLSVSTLVITLRKLVGTLRLGRELTCQMALAASNLDKAARVLRKEYQNFYNEKHKLEACVREAMSMRHDISISLTRMQQMRSQLQKNLQGISSGMGVSFRSAPAGAAVNYAANHPATASPRTASPMIHSPAPAPSASAMMPANTAIRPQQREKNGLPVFVRRKVSKTAAANISGLQQ